MGTRFTTPRSLRAEHVRDDNVLRSRAAAQSAAKVKLHEYHRGTAAACVWASIALTIRSWSNFTSPLLLAGMPFTMIEKA